MDATTVAVDIAKDMFEVAVCESCRPSRRSETVDTSAIRAMPRQSRGSRYRPDSVTLRPAGRPPARHIMAPWALTITRSSFTAKTMARGSPKSRLSEGATR